MGIYLATAAITADLGVLAAANDWPSEVTTAAVVALLWLAWVLSLCAFFALRGQGRRDDWREKAEDEPEPPWWPGFERDLRDYTRRTPRTPVAPRS